MTCAVACTDRAMVEEMKATQAISPPTAHSCLQLIYAVPPHRFHQGKHVLQTRPPVCSRSASGVTGCHSPFPPQPIWIEFIAASAGNTQARIFCKRSEETLEKSGSNERLRQA